MHTPLQAAGYRVMPATMLSDEPIDEQDCSSLRREASTNGVCFVQIIRPLHDGTHLARVAAHPELLPEQGFTIVLTDAQVAGSQWPNPLKGDGLACGVISSRPVQALAD